MHGGVNRGVEGPERGVEQGSGEMGWFGCLERSGRGLIFGVFRASVKGLRGVVKGLRAVGFSVICSFS